LISLRFAQVLPHRHVRVERVVLEDHREVALRGGERRHVALPEHDPSAGDLLETADRAQERRLPAARRADEHHELALADRQVDVVDRDHAAGELLADVLEHDLTHRPRM
jgi:hypothetical protein